MLNIVGFFYSMISCKWKYFFKKEFGFIYVGNLIKYALSTFIHAQNWNWHSLTWQVLFFNSL
jgi:hypothetical protein